MSGIPSVVTMSGDLPELVRHRDTGWVCAEVTPEALADGLEYFLSRPDDFDRAGRAALASAAQYSEARFAAAWSAAFGLHPKEPIHADL
jgi:glycosyltransferase involved in cell wall biosynthesis